MSTQFNSEPIVDTAEVDYLAEVIDLPVDGPSFYQRNSAALPSADKGMSDAHRRASLPSPSYDNDESFSDKIKRMLGMLSVPHETSLRSRR